MRGEPISKLKNNWERKIIKRLYYKREMMVTLTTVVSRDSLKWKGTSISDGRNNRTFWIIAYWRWERNTKKSLLFFCRFVCMNNWIEEFRVVCVCVSRVWLCDPMDYSLPGSSVHGFSRQEYWSGLPFHSPVWDILTLNTYT